MKNNCIVICSIFLLFLCPKHISAQDQQSANDKAHGFYAGAYVTSLFTFRPSFRYFYCCSPSGSEHALMKGIQGGYQFNDNISFKAGIEYFTSEYPGYYSRILPEQEPASFVNANYNVNYFQFPLQLDLFLSKPAKRMRWYLPLGMTYRRQTVHEKLILLDKHENFIREENNSFSENHFYVNLGIGSSFKINDKWHIFAELPLRIGVPRKNIYNRYIPPIPTAGVSLGVNYLFR